MIKLLPISVIAIFAIAPSFADITYPFSVTTVSLNANDNIRFLIGASGIFYVDCGSDGVLTSDTNDISGPTNNSYMITRTNTNQATYTCTYSTGGAKTLRFGGRATGYTSHTDYGSDAAIRFYDYTQDNPAKIASISGVLGDIFPTLGTSNSLQPQFIYTFMNTPITSIPENLFNGVTGHRASMFSYTFYGTQITQIPSDLFDGVSGCEDAMFNSTFRECTNLISIPENLFSGVTCAYNYMFGRLFNGCSNLQGYIPASTFSGLVTAGHPTASNFWYEAFSGTQLVTSCPPLTTQYITGYEGFWNGKVACQGSPFTVTYSCGSGTGTAPTTNINANYGSAFTPALTTCAKTGYHFAGWMISGTNDIKPAGTAFIWEYTNDKTFTAQYEINTINLSWFDGAQQLTVPSAAESCTYDQHMILPTPLTKAGYQFTGWRLIPGH